MDEKKEFEVRIKITKELAEEIDALVELVGFESRERFVESAIRRLINQYKEKTRLIHTYS